MSLEFHPVANLFPLMSQIELRELTADIKAHGLLEPIWLHSDGRIVDGRNRYKACPADMLRTRTYEGAEDDLISFVVSLNLKRRHLTDSQRAALAVPLEAIYAEQAKERQRQAGKQRAKSAARDDSGRLGEPTQLGPTLDQAGKGKREPKAAERAAKDLHVGKSSVAKAKNLAKNEPDLFEQVTTGKKNLTKADREARERSKEREREEAKQQVIEFETDDMIIRRCSVVDLSVDAASIDLVFTDPPYHREHLDRWSELGKFASHALKPGGLVVAYSGQMFLPEVMARLGEHLEYWWCYAISHDGAFFQMNARHTQVGWKPLLVYRKPGTGSPPWCNDIYADGHREKTGHDWQQAEAEATYWIDKLTQRGDLVADPFLGSGTTAAVCKRLGRRFIGCDVDPLAVKTSRERVI